jgi:CheY-like chemotaxis protein
VQAHYEILRVTEYGVTGRVLYVDGARPRPAAVERARRVLVDPIDRAAVQARLDDARRVGKLRENAEERAVAEQELKKLLGASHGEVVASLESGVFEIVPDPFGKTAAKRPRVLVADDDPTTAGAVNRMGLDVEVEKVTDGWAALDRIVTGQYDLVLCAVKLGDLGGAKIFKMVAKEKPAAASRIFFVADADTVASAPPSSASGRVLARPVDATAVKSLLERFRQET